VTGEAGIGKTRLVHDVVQAAGGRGVELATAVCATGAPALWPIRSLLESLGCDTAPLDEPRDDFGVWRAASRALRDVASDQPLLLVVEDLQWADRATVTLLEHLVADHELGEVTLVMTRRTAEGDDAALSRLAAAVARSGGLRVDLTPLSCAEAAELARTVDPQVADPESIGRRAGGNPLFVTALALGDGRVTGTLADVVRARVGGLAPDARVALELASAADGPVDPAFVATVAGCERDDAEAALDVAMRAGLLRGDRPEPTCYRFEHEVVREVLRLDLPSRTRARCRQHAERLAPVRVHRRERSASDPVVAELMRIANPAASAVRAS
jgi:predicted ATPase